MRKTITSIDTALRLYYENVEIGNKEIVELFGNMSSRTIVAMKNEVLEKMTEKNISRFCRNMVNTEVAYEVWGIDVNDLERRRNKLIKLGFAMQ